MRVVFIKHGEAVKVPAVAGASASEEPMRRNATTTLQALMALALGVSCASGGTEPSQPATRTYRMGFAATPPRLTLAEVLRTLDSLTRHSDAALMVVDVPWAALLADTAPAVLIQREQLELARYSSSARCRSR